MSPSGLLGLLGAKLLNLNVFQPEVVSRYRDPQTQVDKKNFAYMCRRGQVSGFSQSSPNFPPVFRIALSIFWIFNILFLLQTNI